MEGPGLPELPVRGCWGGCSRRRVENSGDKKTAPQGGGILGRCGGCAENALYGHVDPLFFRKVATLGGTSPRANAEPEQRVLGDGGWPYNCRKHAANCRPPCRPEA